MSTEGNEPAAPSTQAIEQVTHATQQSAGLTKRESAAIASMKGWRAGGSKEDPEKVAELAWADADALFAASGKGGAA